MDFNYKIKKRYPYNNQDNDYMCEIRTKVPMAHVLIKVNSWSDVMEVSLNGKGHFRSGDFKVLDRAIDEAKNRIYEAQHGTR